MTRSEVFEESEKQRVQGVGEAKGSRSRGFKDSSGSLGIFFQNQKRQGVGKAIISRRARRERRERRDRISSSEQEKDLF